jgi:hypothetical protein
VNQVHLPIGGAQLSGTFPETEVRFNVTELLVGLALKIPAHGSGGAAGNVLGLFALK